MKKSSWWGCVLTAVLVVGCGGGSTETDAEVDAASDAEIDATSDAELDAGEDVDAGADAEVDAAPEASVPCGNGVLEPAEGEACDDGDVSGGDGCSESCALEVGFDCSGEPTVCVATCGDGILVGDETCDDLGVVAGDGCGADCQAESGYMCTGAPSTCVTTCNDGIRAGDELCDDGNAVFGDGCSPECVPNDGEDCSQPLLAAQATVEDGVYTWVVPAGGVVEDDGVIACDPNTHGPDVVVTYAKTTPDLANGGALLHVRASQPGTATAGFLNVEVRSGDCEDAGAASHTCLWYNAGWDSYLDLPAGTYHVWVGKNSPATMSVGFPETTITIAEIPAMDAEGEGCYAPYTIESAIYTPPLASGEPHVFTIPDTINAFDMGATWGGPGSISCDDTPPYGDIHGADAVIAYTKTSPTSVLYVEVENTDPNLAASDLNVEILSICDPTEPAKISRNCRANADVHALTAPGATGTSYIWVSTEATGEELRGAIVRVSEIFPAEGESASTAETLAASGPIAQTSARRLDPPSCFPATGPVHWFVYTLAEDALAITPTGVGPIALLDESMQVVACQPAGAPVGRLAGPGARTYVAVGAGITGLGVSDVAYDGVRGQGVDLGITFPSSPIAEAALTLSGDRLYLGLTSAFFEIPKTTGATAIEHGAADGIELTHLGYGLVFAGGALFAADSSSATTTSRIFHVFDGTTYAPTAWDLAPSYLASSPIHALATDGTSVFAVTRRTSAPTAFYSLPTAAPATPTLLGTNPDLSYAVALAADAQFFYALASGTAGTGVYRVPRSNVAAAPTMLMSIATSTTNGALAVDDLANPSVLYVRSGGPVHAVVEPDGAGTPVGVVSALGGGSDYSMAYDHAADVLYVFSTDPNAAGAILRIE